jgi:uncharacterized protein YqeY
MSIKEKLKADMIAAMKGKEKDRLECIRFIQAAVKKVEVDTRKDLDDAAIISILMNQTKQRKDSIDQFKKGGREDLVAKEEAELKILQSYLPEQMGAEELKNLIELAVKETGASSMKEMGLVIKAAMAKVAGRAEGSVVSDLVKKRLTQG